MARATVEREIARLDAISRTRALDRAETILLVKHIRAEKAWKAYAARRASAPRGPRAPGENPARRGAARGIVDRLTRAIDQMERDGMSVRAIYLNDPDLAELEVSAEPSSATGCFRGHPVRHRRSAEKGSIIYSTFGVSRAVRRFP